MENGEIKSDIAAKRLFGKEPAFSRMVNQYCFDNQKEVIFDDNSERDTRSLELRLSNKEKMTLQETCQRCKEWIQMQERSKTGGMRIGKDEGIRQGIQMILLNNSKEKITDLLNLSMNDLEKILE